MTTPPCCRGMSSEKNKESFLKQVEEILQGIKQDRERVSVMGKGVYWGGVKCAGKEEGVCWGGGRCVLGRRKVCAGEEEGVCWEGGRCAGEEEGVCWEGRRCVLGRMKVCAGEEEGVEGK